MKYQNELHDIYLQTSQHCASILSACYESERDRADGSQVGILERTLASIRERLSITTETSHTCASLS